MIWHFYPWSQIPTLLSCVFAFLIAVKAWQRRPASGTVPLAVLMMAILLWSLVGGIEDANDNFGLKIYCFDVEFIACASIPVLWVIMLLDYLGYQHLLTRRNIILVSIIPSLAIILCWTNSAHGLLFSHRWLAVSGQVHYLDSSYNFGFWIFLGYSYLLVLTGLIICLLASFSSVLLYRRQALVLFFVALIPLVVNIFDVTYSFLPEWNLTPMAFLFTGWAMIWGMNRVHLWDLTPVAHQIMFQKMGDGVFVVDRSHRIVEINAAGCTILGSESKACIGQPIDHFLSKVPGLSIEHLGESDIHLVSEWTESAFRVYDIFVTPLGTSPDQCPGWVVVMRDISERIQLEQQLQAMAYYDALTGLPNRVLFQDRLEQIISRSHRSQTSTGVIFVDIDHFKDINDAHGHALGDEILQLTAQSLKTAVRESDTVSRYGGDEFVLILPELPDREALAQIAERILEQFSMPVTLRGQSFPISLSLGLTLAPLDGDNVETLVKNADSAMYEAKDSGGRGYVLYTPHLLLVKRNRIL